MAADTKEVVHWHVKLEGPTSSNRAKSIEEQPTVGNIQSHQLTGALKIMANDNVVEQEQMKLIMQIVLACGASCRNPRKLRMRRVQQRNHQFEGLAVAETSCHDGSV